jgi:subtilisin family serine protease
MKMRPLSAAVALLLASLAASALADDVRRPYIVQLADQPVASYTGDIDGLPATQPAPGGRLDIDSTEVHLYSDYLGQKQQVVRASVANAPVTYNYSVVLNGFAAMLTDDEVRALQARTDVAAVTLDTPREVVTTYTSHFLGLDKPDGLWTKLGGKTSAGENVIIGVVDGGIWPENPAYADRVDGDGKPTFDNSGTLAYGAPPANWKGTCQAGEGFTVANCNNKLIGAQYFDTTFRSLPQYVTHWSEFRSPRDSIGGTLGHGGHGTHTSSTAGGNAGPEAIVSGVNLGPVSGMAPRARIAMYKVCWSFNDATDPTGAKNSCFTGDSVAAIEKAVTDGVNVINFSISGGASVTDPVEQAFLHASNAGVFVSASAGNEGPANTVAHISPWQATVAASTHNRELQSDVILGDGRKFTGASMITTALPAAPMITSEQAALAGADATAATLCFSSAWASPTWTAKPTLDPAKVNGKIVTCTRGTNDRLDKSRAVKEAGGVGMVEIDNGVGLVAEVHAVPTVHVSAANGALIKAYAASQNSTASMTTFVTGTSSVPAPVVAAFSSRGPNLYDSNQLKPDLAAPGVDIIAAVTPQMTQAQRANVVNGTAAPVNAWASYQGTSMAAPHVAGIAALLKQEHPTWTPAMIKSALMTTATDTFSDGITDDTAGKKAFGQGAGHINPNGASDPGLVFNAVQADYQKYMCGLGVVTNCTGGAIAGYNLNLPSIAVGNILVGVTVTRSVTNVGPAGTYTPTISVPGYAATVSPTSLAMGENETKSFTVTLTRGSAVSNVWNYGSLTWDDQAGHKVRIPIVARSGQPVIAPDRITLPKTSAMKAYSITTGFTGAPKAVIGGLKEIVRSANSVSQAASKSVDDLAGVKTACNAAGSGVRVTPLTIPANTLVAQFEVFERDTQGAGGPGGTDLDLAILNSAGNVLAYSNNAGSNDAVLLRAPAAGSYKLCVIGWQTSTGGAISYSLSSAVVTSADKGGNFKALLPAKVYAGSTATVSAAWSGLAAGKRFLGAVQMLDTAGAPAATTLFQVETNNPVSLGEPTLRNVVQQDSGI